MRKKKVVLMSSTHRSWDGAMSHREASPRLLPTVCKHSELKRSVAEVFRGNVVVFLSDV